MTNQQQPERSAAVEQCTEDTRQMAFKSFKRCPAHPHPEGKSIFELWSNGILHPSDHEVGESTVTSTCTRHWGDLVLVHPLKPPVWQYLSRIVNVHNLWPSSSKNLFCGWYACTWATLCKEACKNTNCSTAYNFKREGGGRRGSGWGTHAHPWQIHVNAWQNQYNVVK